LFNLLNGCAIEVKFPDNKNSYILITSRNQKWEISIKVLPLGTFTEEEALVY
jgi:hypothetical protein